MRPRNAFCLSYNNEGRNFVVVESLDWGCSAQTAETGTTLM